MFCHKCGGQVPKATRFCHKCGSRISVKEPIKETISSSESTPKPSVRSSERIQKNASGSPTSVVVKSKINKWTIFKATVAIVIILVIIFTFLEDSSPDYVEAVWELAPFEAEGISATYGEVISQLITSPSWIVYPLSDTSAYIEIVGRVRDIDGSYFGVSLTL